MHTTPIHHDHEDDLDEQTLLEYADNSSSTTGIIIGVVVGLLVIGGLVWWWKRDDIELWRLQKSIERQMDALEADAERRETIRSQ
jgi:hypothetical protein